MVSRLKFHYWNVVVVLALVLCETLVESQYYLEDEAPAPPGPLYLYNSDLVAHAGPFVPTEEGRGFNGRSSAQNNEEEAPGRNFAARSGRRADSDEEDEDDEDQEIRIPSRSFKKSMTHPPGRSRPVHLPPGFDDKVRKRMRINRNTRKAPLHGDPELIDEEDDEGRKPESRLLWPFSIEITKGSKDKGGWGGGGGGPGGYGSYHEWLSNTHGYGGWGPITGPYGSWGSHGPGLSHPYGWKPGDLTDEEILNSKHYKKYRKKKKKKIKKLKKKLKFKRLIQKILQKHITYLDKIAPY